MPRRLRYSERKAIAEKGGLGPLSEQPSDELKNAVFYLLKEGEESECGTDFQNAMYGACVKHFGWRPGGLTVGEAISRGTDLGAFLDLIEILCEEAAIEYTVYAAGGMVDYPATAIPKAEQKINDLFDRHRFGYRLQDGEIVKIGSPALDDVVTGPALLASQRAGWEEVERSYKEALHHQRGGADENDDALTSACAAVEAALKAAGYRGDRLGPLAKDFRNSVAVPAELAGVPEVFDTLLHRIGAIRSSHGDSHGKHAGAAEVPQALVDLAIHWAGAFIVYLDAEHP